MKKLIFTSLLFIWMSLTSVAYGSTPTETWPYAFDSFRSGVIHFEAPYADLVADINICVANGHLHYIEDGVIMESVTKGIVSAEIDGKLYRCYRGEMIEVIAENENGYVGTLTLFDPTQMGQVDIGFGMTSSTYAASNVDLSSAWALGSRLVHAKVADVALNKGDGAALPVASKVYVVAGDKRIQAVKSDFQDLVGKADASAFLKANKVKWNSPETLLPVVDFIAAH